MFDCVSFVWIPRSENKVADALAEYALMLWQSMPCRTHPWAVYDM